MDKYTIFKTISSLLDKKHKLTLSFSEEARTLLYECDTEVMHRVMFDLYAARNSSEEYIKMSIAKINEKTKKSIGFGIDK